MAYFTEDLINSIKLRSLAPMSQSTYDDDDILTLAYEELETKLVADLIDIREDFFVTSETFNILAGKSHYGIPARAIGEALKDLKLFDSNGNFMPCARIDVSRRGEFERTGNPQAYYFEGDEIVLVPTPTISQGTVQMHFPAKPSKLVLTSSCAKITNFASVGGTTTFDVDTDLTAALAVGFEIDFLSSSAPFKHWSYKVPITSITASTIAVDTSEVLGQDGTTIEPRVGDMICPTDTANIPQIPTAFHPVLAQMVCVRLMESLGDINKLNATVATLERLRVDATKLVRNRVESAPQKVSSRGSLVRYFR